MSAPRVFRDANGSCVHEDGCYQLFYLKDGANIETLRLVTIDSYNHAALALTEVDNDFSKQVQRSRVSEILAELKNSAKKRFSEYVRFPRSGTFIQLDTSDFNSIESGLTAAAKYSDKDDERDVTIPNSTKGQQLKAMGPDTPGLGNLQKVWAYNNSSVLFNKTLLRFKNYGISNLHSHTRLSFELFYNLVWCCDTCCSPATCVLECEDRFTFGRFDDDKPTPPKQPGKGKDPNFSNIQFIFDGIMKRKKSHKEPKYWFLDPITSEEIPTCSSIDNYKSVTELLDLKARVPSFGFILQSPSENKFDIYRYSFAADYLILEEQDMDQLDCSQSNNSDLKLKSFLLKENFKDYDIEDPRLLLGDTSVLDCDTLNQGLILRKNRTFKVPMCGLLILHKKNTGDVSVFYYDLKTGSNFMVKTIECDLVESS